MVGFELDEDISRTEILEYYPEDQHGLVMNEIIPAMTEQGHWKGETFFRSFRTGARIPVSDEHFMITASDTGEVLGMGTVTRDITDIREAEEALRERAEALEEFSDLATGRELRMVELKREVNELLREQGKPPRYDLSGLEEFD